MANAHHHTAKCRWTSQTLFDLDDEPKTASQPEEKKDKPLFSNNDMNQMIMIVVLLGAFLLFKDEIMGIFNDVKGTLEGGGAAAPTPEVEAPAEGGGEEAPEAEGGEEAGGGDRVSA